MSLCREKIERLELKWSKDSDCPWKAHSYSRKWRKKQMNKYIRLQGKHIDDDDVGCKRGRKPISGWEY